MLTRPTPAQIASGPRRRCNQCGEFPLKPLAKFHAEDVTTSPTSLDSYEAPGLLRFIAPFWSLMLVLISWSSNLLFDAAKTKATRAKVRKAHAEILPRSPDALICPRCYEILEVIED